MTIAAFAMNGLLVVLLAAALAFGWRLERRLKALKDSHDGFAKAVSDLDEAARRAEQGLADLRAATDEAAEALADRIEKARALTGQLDRKLSEQTEPERFVRASASDSEPHWSPPRETPKSRAKVDDELFEPDLPSLRTISGGRR